MFIDDRFVFKTRDTALQLTLNIQHLVFLKCAIPVVLLNYMVMWIQSKHNYKIWLNDDVY